MPSPSGAADQWPGPPRPPGQVARSRLGCVCETTGRPPGAGGACPAGQVRCGGGCLRADRDLANCGACGKACPASPVPCLVPVCRNGACGYAPAADGSPCDDGDPCTTGGVCRRGVCVGGAPVVCPPLDQCHDAGTCDPVTGQCTHPAKDDGTSCDDENPCTTSDACWGGVCTGDPVVCDDGLACTESACGPHGECVHPIVSGWCVIDGACVAAGTRHPVAPCQWCDPTKSQTDWSSAPLGTACDDETRCNGREACDGAGACVAGVPASCAPPDECQEEGVCDPASGECSYALKLGWCRIDGVCVATGEANPANRCLVCDPGQDLNAWSNAPAGAACDDDTLCSGREFCDGQGRCVPGDPVVCDPPGECREEGVCNPATGECTYAPKPAGTPCGQPASCVDRVVHEQDACDGAGNCRPGDEWL